MTTGILNGAIKWDWQKFWGLICTVLIAGSTFLIKNCGLPTETKIPTETIITKENK